MANVAGDPGIINFQGISDKDPDQCGSTNNQFNFGNFGGCASAIAGPRKECQRKGTETGNVLAPWVIAEFGVLGEGHKGNKITVSNNSSFNTKPKNTAIIQSFEFSFSEGIKVNIVIHDQEGGSFVDFVDNIFNDWNCLKGGAAISAPQVKFQFGWVKSGCGLSSPTTYSQCYYGIITGIDTSFAEGKFITELTIVGIAQLMVEGHADKTIGDEGENKVCLADAIKELLTNGVAPNVKFVSFRKWEGGKVVPAGFACKEDGCEVGEKQLGSDGFPFVTSKGPKYKWIPESQDKLTCAMRWLEKWNSDSTPPKGWYPRYNPTILGGEIIFWEDEKPDCEAKDDNWFKERCIGVYIVNGSDQSPVLEFNTKIKWLFGQLRSGGGGMGNDKVKAVKFEGSKSPGRRDCPGLTRPDVPGAGHPMQITSTEALQAKWGGDAEDEGQKAQVIQLKAFKVNQGPFNAELVLVGDPTFNPVLSIQKYLTIIFINPYFLQKGKGCQDWSISDPPCNEVLTSRAWRIQGIFHKIELGKYTTHLSVVLAGPGGEDGPVGEPLGLWFNGWKPKICS